MRRLLLPLLLLSLLGGCARLGYFLEWPSSAKPPASDWAEGAHTRAWVTPEQLPDWRVSYVQSGDTTGQRVLFVHGSPGYAGDWSAYLGAVPQGFEFLSVDRPGFGFTEPLKPLKPLDLQAAALEPLLTSGNGKPVILVGWSLGAPVIARAAVDYPGKVAGIVLVAGALDPDLEHVRVAQRFGHIPPFRYFVKDTWRIANDELIGFDDELEKMAPLLARVRVPVVILHGTGDTLVPVGNVEFMKAHFTNSADLHVELFDGRGHGLPFREPARIYAAIERIAKHIGAIP